MIYFSSLFCLYDPNRSGALLFPDECFSWTQTFSQVRWRNHDFNGDHFCHRRLWCGNILCNKQFDQQWMSVRLLVTRIIEKNKTSHNDKACMGHLHPSHFLTTFCQSFLSHTCYLSFTTTATNKYLSVSFQ